MNERKKLNTTANFVRRIRKRLGITQREFAQKIGKTRDAVANYETCRAIPPGDVVLKIQELENHHQSQR